MVLFYFYFRLALRLSSGSYIFRLLSGFLLTIVILEAFSSVLVYSRMRVLLMALPFFFPRMSKIEPWYRYSNSSLSNPSLRRSKICIYILGLLMFLSWSLLLLLWCIYCLACFAKGFLVPLDNWLSFWCFTYWHWLYFKFIFLNLNCSRYNSFGFQFRLSRLNSPSFSARSKFVLLINLFCFS